jgi:hypothetical protein
MNRRPISSFGKPLKTEKSAAHAAQRHDEGEEFDIRQGEKNNRNEYISRGITYRCTTNPNFFIGGGIRTKVGTCSYYATFE